MRTLPADIEHRTEVLAANWRPPTAQFAPAQALIDLTPSPNLKELDDAFIEQFNLAAYYPLEPIRYPTVCCETLEEFYTPMVEEYDLSPEKRKEILAVKVAEAEALAEQSLGEAGTFGYNLPGRGAYVNGWLFAYKHKYSPKKTDDMLSDIMTTAAHEKLGHGFLAAYSALGQVKSQLGFTQMEIASKFNLRTADDPATSLRRAQYNLLHQVSQLLEEGWATWVASLLAKSVYNKGKHPRYDFNQVVTSIKCLPADLPQRGEIQKALLGSITLLLDKQDQPFEVIRPAILTLEVVGSMVDDIIPLEQPLRYAVGELLLSQAETNLGIQCVPFAVLIAANITFDPASIGMTDLDKLLANDPRLNPDVRMAFMSRIQLPNKNDVREMAKFVAAQLSFSIPTELQG